MYRRELILLIGGAASARPLAAFAATAQKPARMRKIGRLHTGAEAKDDRLETILMYELAKLGWVEGRNLAVERRYAGDRLERLGELAAELARLEVDALVTFNFAAAKAAKEATSTIPIVLVGVGDPVASGLVASLARPGGNVTGLSFLVSAEIGSKRVQILKEAVPGMTRLAVVHLAANAPSLAVLQDIQAGARTLGIAVEALEVGSTSDLDSAMAALAARRPDAVVVLTGAVIATHRAGIVEFLMAQRLPSIYSVREFVDLGGLMSYGPDLADVHKRAASFVDKLLKGAKPADLPVEQPTRFELVLNRKAAKAIGLELPPALLARADDVIE
jgi:putative ABC transport system substrate-binding protein